MVMPRQPADVAPTLCVEPPSRHTYNDRYSEHWFPILLLNLRATVQLQSSKQQLEFIPVIESKPCHFSKQTKRRDYL